jgi:hypothetical protein
MAMLPIGAEALSNCKCLQDGNKCFKANDACSNYQAMDGEAYNGCKAGAQANTSCPNSIDYKLGYELNSNKDLSETDCPTYTVWSCISDANRICVAEGTGSTAACPGGTYHACVTAA